MPPQLSDDETSEASEQVPSTPKNDEKKASVEEQTLMVESDDNKEASDKEDEDDEEVGEDVYVLEAITNHLIDEETGELLYEVKWEGYEKKSDRTWEPESNLKTASKVLNEYLESVGGKEHLLAEYATKKAAAGENKGKKRVRQSTGTPQGETNGSKKSRKNKHPLESTPPASAKRAEFKPPAGNWEDEVVLIDACEGSGGDVIVYLTWKNGFKSQHALAQVYKRCPQKMLKFYESHLVFKKSE